MTETTLESASDQPAIKMDNLLGDILDTNVLNGQLSIEDFNSDQYELIEFTDDNKTRLVSLVNSMLSEFEPLESLSQTSRLLSRLSCLVEFFNNFFRLIELEPSICKLPMPIRIDKDSNHKDLKPIEDRQQQEDIMCYFRCWLSMFYDCDDIIDSLNLDTSGSMEMTTFMILNIFQQMNDCLPQLRAIINLHWFWLNEIDQHFQPVLKYKKITEIIQEQLIQERIHHQHTRERLKLLQEQLNKKNKQLEELKTELKKLNHQNRCNRNKFIKKNPTSISTTPESISVNHNHNTTNTNAIPKISTAPTISLLTAPNPIATTTSIIASVSKSAVTNQYQSILLTPPPVVVPIVPTSAGGGPVTATGPVIPQIQVISLAQPPTLPQAQQQQAPSLAPLPAQAQPQSQHQLQPPQKKFRKNNGSGDNSAANSTASSPASIEPIVLESDDSNSPTKPTTTTESTSINKNMLRRKRNRPKKFGQEPDQPAQSQQPDIELIETTQVNNKHLTSSIQTTTNNNGKKSKKIRESSSLICNAADQPTNNNQTTKPKKKPKMSLLKPLSKVANNNSADNQQEEEVIIQPLQPQMVSLLSHNDSMSPVNGTTLPAPEQLDSVAIIQKDSTPNSTSNDTEQVQTGDETSDLTSYYYIDDLTQSINCRVCKEKFSTLDQFRVHLMYHLCKKLFPCEHCPKIFSNRYKLTRHEACHSTDRPFRCNICNKAFSRADKVREHVKTVHYATGSKKKRRIGKAKTEQTQQQVIETKQEDDDEQQIDESKKNGQMVVVVSSQKTEPEDKEEEEITKVEKAPPLQDMNDLLSLIDKHSDSDDEPEIIETTPILHNVAS